MMNDVFQITAAVGLLAIVLFSIRRFAGCRKTSAEIVAKLFNYCCRRHRNGEKDV
ncbi:MAG: hypothetical protein WC335_06345 [Candidatus Omnitrophota bacterium]